MVYEPLYHALQIWLTVRICSKVKTSWKSVVFTNKVGKISRYFVGISNKTIIPLSLVGYEMIIANSALHASLANYHLISNMHSWNNIDKYKMINIIIISVISSIIITALLFFMPSTWAMAAKVCLWLSNLSTVSLLSTRKLISRDRTMLAEMKTLYQFRCRWWH